MVKFSDETESFTELIFGFLEGVEESSESSCSCSFSFHDGESIDEVDDDKNIASDVEVSKAFWESQEELLKATLCRTTSIETEIRQTTKEALREISSVGVNCVCQKFVGNSCRNCFQKDISDRLKIAGHNCVICKSKWKRSLEIPSGEHSYMEVVHNSGAKGEVKVIIEPNFRVQFEMARASDEYNRLINLLPEVFVGKLGRLQNLVKILCAASKKCMKERNMHIAPWRKHKYMLAKWHGTPELKSTPVLPVRHLESTATRPRASMLTYDLLDHLPGMHCTMMIKVI